MEDFIKDLQSFDPGVPDPSEFIRVCPPPNKGGTHTEETKRLISEAMRGRVKSEEEIEKIKNALTGKPKCATHSKNVSKAQTGEKSRVPVVFVWSIVGRLLPMCRKSRPLPMREKRRNVNRNRAAKTHKGVKWNDDGAGQHHDAHSPD